MKIPVRQDGPPKSIRQFAPPEKTASYRERQAFYKGRLWLQTRAVKLRNNPLCEVCEQAGRIEQATQVHHVIERLSRPDLAFDMSNLESICATCHGAARAKKNGV